MSQNLFVEDEACCDNGWKPRDWFRVSEELS